MDIVIILLNSFQEQVYSSLQSQVLNHMCYFSYYETTKEKQLNIGNMKPLYKNLLLK